MESKRVEEIMQSHGVINISYNGMPVWIEGIRGDVAEVSLINMEKSMDVPISALTEADPLQTM
jgi:small acid-soluble spore protein H (minor)